MEVLNEDDLDWLTRVENRLANMRKRETHHYGEKTMLVYDLTDTIKPVRNLRIMLQARFEKATDESL